MQDDWTPLHRAVNHGQRECAVLLIEKGVQLEAKDEVRVYCLYR
jgi:ankyrin repeat protein